MAGAETTAGQSRLGRTGECFYGGLVIGFLRVVGVTNAAVWFGTAVFYSLFAGPALTSTGARTILGETNFPYFGVAMAELLRARYLQVHFLCASLALIHLGVEWLYLGRIPKRGWGGLLALLFWFGLMGSFWLSPKLQEAHRNRHLVGVPIERQAQSARAYRAWKGVFHVFNLVLAGGAAACLWRATHPPDELRFVGTPKFRS